MKDIICEIMGISQATYYRRKEEKPVIKLLEKYFNEDELKQFLKEEKIERLEAPIVLNKEMHEFFFNNAIHKIIIKSTLPIDENDNIVFKTFKAILNKNRSYSLLPLATFLKYLNSSNVVDTNTYLATIKESKINISWKNIITQFCTYELSSLEMDSILKNKARIYTFFEEEKNNKNCMLNFS